MGETEKGALDDYLKAQVPIMIEKHLGLEATKAQVAEAVAAVVTKIKESKDDPYRTTIHFVAALITFSLGVIAATFSALNGGDVNPQLVAYRMLGGVLGSIAIVAWVSTAVAAVIQILKFTGRNQHKIYNWRVISMSALMTGLVSLGGVAVAYCVRYGYAILTSKSAPVGLWDSLTGLFCLAF